MIVGVAENRNTQTLRNCHNLLHGVARCTTGTDLDRVRWKLLNGYCDIGTIPKRVRERENPALRPDKPVQSRIIPFFC